MQKNTTGAAVSRFAVLGVLAYNRLEENHLSMDERTKAIEELAATAKGERGISTEKLTARLNDRCVVGGALFQVQGIGLWGVN